MSLRADLLSVLGSDSADLPPSIQSPDFWTAARAEGVHCLAAEALARRGSALPAGLAETVRRERAADAVRVELDRLDLVRVLATLHSVGIPALVIKGAALSWTVYREPHLRPVVDIDLLIKEEHAAAARRTFEALGAELVPHVTGPLVMSQFHYVTRGTTRMRHSYDVHTRAVNPVVFADALHPERLFSRAAAADRISPLALTPALGDALLLACMHKAAHHGASRRLIWLYDIHLLATLVSEAEGRDLVEYAAATKVFRVLRAGLEDAHAAFSGPATARLRERCDAAAPHAGAELSAPYARGPVTPLRDVWLGMRAMTGWRMRLELFRQLAFPTASYMRQKYPGSGRTPLWCLHLARLVAGGIRWLRRR